MLSENYINNENVNLLGKKGIPVSELLLQTHYNILKLDFVWFSLGGSQLEVLKIYSWLCALIFLMEVYGIPGNKAKSVPCKHAPYSLCDISDLKTYFNINNIV